MVISLSTYAFQKVINEVAAQTVWVSRQVDTIAVVFFKFNKDAKIHLQALDPSEK